jgi:hypothetical protein
MVSNYLPREMNYAADMRRRVGFLLTMAFLGCAEGDPPANVDAAGASDTRVDDVAIEVASDVAMDATCKLVKAFSSKNVVCNSCAESKCCVEVNGCLGDKGCDDDYVNCALACALLPADAGDAGAEKERCLNECATMYPDGKKRYDAAFGCVDSKCSTECN